jgi:hypothetical protein
MLAFRSIGARTGAVIAVLAAILGALACDDNSSAENPLPRFDTTFLEFDDVAAGTQVDRTFTLRNAGGGVIEGTFASTICDPPTMAEGSPCWSLVGDPTYRLEGGQAKTFTVRFAPYSLSAPGGACGIGTAHCQVESSHGIVHCHAVGVDP